MVIFGLLGYGFKDWVRRRAFLEGFYFGASDGGEFAAGRVDRARKPHGLFKPAD